MPLHHKAIFGFGVHIKSNYIDNIVLALYSLLIMLIGMISNYKLLIHKLLSE